MSGRKSVPVQVAIRSAVAEALESRRLLTATFWVTSAAASGPGSFADVIGVANANPGPDTIAFNINGGGPALIQMTAGLPTITDPVTIDGTTQPGYAGTPLVHLRGDTTSVLAGGDRGLHFASTAGGSVVHGLRMSNWWQAISGAADLTPAPVTVVANHITGNWFGVYTGAQWTVGGTTPAARNVIAGNQYGIRLLANSVVQGNYIGTDPSGTMAHANVYGVELHGNNATIGGTTAEARNVISGNTVGISGLASGTSLLARVLGNYIGTDATGAAPLGNGVGIDLRSSFTAGTDIGANVPGGGNVIAYNSGAGVRLLPTGDTRIIGNSIFANGGLEIDVSPDGVNAAAYGAPIAPVVTSAHRTDASLVVKGTVGTTDAWATLLCFYASPTAGGTGSGDGRTFLGTGWAQGDGSFSVTLPSVPAGQYVTATRTRMAWERGTGSSTSEFSAAAVVVEQPPTVTGALFADTNGNGIRDANTPETWIAGRTVYVDANDNRQFDAGELTTVTDASGNYLLTLDQPGTYSVRQILPSGWGQTVPLTTATPGGTPAYAPDTARVVTVATGQTVAGQDFGSAPATGSVSGALFDDRNANSVRDYGEPGLAGRAVMLVLPTAQPAIASTVSDANGNYSFANLVPGHRHLRATVSGWQGVNVSDGFLSVTATVGAVADANLGYIPAGAIGGTVFRDADADGVYAGEAGMYNQLVYIDSNNNGGWDNGERLDDTDLNGMYLFPGLAPGTYVVRAHAHETSRITAPASGVHTVVVGTVPVHGRDFGLTTAAAISAFVFHDTNGNGTRDGDEGALDGRTVYLDLNDNSVLDASEPTAVSKAGPVWFGHLPGGTYTIRQVVPAGWRQSSPTTAGAGVTVNAIPGNNHAALFGQAPADTSPTKLTGTPIGTAGAYNNGANTKERALDGSLSTFFDAPVGTGAWVGLDLGSARQVTLVRYAPRGSYPGRMVGGKFQASNTADFSGGVVDLYTVTAAPAAGVLTSHAVTAGGAYRYVRYLSPAGGWGNVAEVEFWAGGGGDQPPPPPPPPADDVPLAGTPIGTAGSYGNWGNTKERALDGSLSTYFDAPTSTAWVGLDLGEAKRVTAVRYAPRASYPGRMVGGKFQASNAADFSSGVVDLFTVAAAPPVGVLTSQPVNGGGGAYRYVRYLSPANGWGNVAEVQFLAGAQQPPPPPPPPPATVSKFAGTVIGTGGSYNNGGSTRDKAFDGNLSSYFDAPVGTGAWVGLDLGTARAVTQVRFAPRSGWAGRMVGGKFQGSNTGDFSSGVVDLYTVTAAPTVGVLTSQAVGDGGAYRYVRYLSPTGGWGNVAEVEFWG